MIKDYQKEEIKRLYNLKISLTDIEKRLKISRQYISRYLKSQNIEVINYQNITKFNSKFFDKIDNEESAYWLGFLYADGNVSKKNNTIELSLGLKDYNHLLKFKESLKLELEVKRDHFRCRLAVTNKHLKQRLIRLGCVPVKSLILKFPTIEYVPKEMLPHFIRGYFDGDGHIRYTNVSNRPQFSLLGTKEFLTALIETVGLPLKLKKDKRHKNNTYYVAYFGTNSIKFLNYIYSNSTIHLDRKFEVYNNSFAVQERNLLNN